MAHLVLNCDGVDLVTDKLGNVTTIGRAPSNHIVIDNPTVSAQHAINREIRRLLSAERFGFNKRDTGQWRFYY